MIYELRVYEAMPGKLPALNSRMEKYALPLFARHGIKSIGYWTTDVGNHNHELTYMVAWQDMNQRQAAWGNFRQDPDWQHALKETHAGGWIVKRASNQLLLPTGYSPLK
jgi:hypothetical protein